MDESLYMADHPVDIDSSKSESHHSNILSVVDHEQDIQSDHSIVGVEANAIHGSQPHTLPPDDQNIVISESQKIDETQLIATFEQPPLSNAQSKSTDLPGHADPVNVSLSTSPTDSNESRTASQQAERTLPHSPRPIIPIRRMPRAEEQLLNPRSVEERSKISTGIQTDLMANGQIQKPTSDDVLRPRIRYQSDGTFTTFAVDYHMTSIRCKRGREEDKAPMKTSEDSDEKTEDEAVEIAQEKEEVEVEVEEDRVPKRRKLAGFIPSVKSLAIFALGGVATVAGILAFEDI
ncbi:uncharacterized protein MELLADRAFT_71079 [Melampsora larici-populina 98AG31]|uniref:Uncharacterized protein n=1 Tax=Melampsora larici-populina (strain 98AG31 / pathotype 3-4-7) TaxID=747676 RepID=F4RBX6_MELLP|nr:uncharacterized protein MELLADRAFT_71079 [Melampsora larici-populina 98AG31]EGG10182.1 hypothetical protein MELLADRAFT_71079 [Melampsora larici-populina 98AG31]